MNMKDHLLSFAVTDNATGTEKRCMAYAIPLDSTVARFAVLRNEGGDEMRGSP
jgi:hypothetical protein